MLVTPEPSQTKHPGGQPKAEYLGRCLLSKTDGARGLSDAVEEACLPGVVRGLDRRQYLGTDRFTKHTRWKGDDDPIGADTVNVEMQGSAQRPRPSPRG